MNIFELHEQFCNERLLIRNFTQATIKWYKGTFRLLMKSCPNLSEVNELTTTHLQRFLFDGRIKRNWSAETFINYYKGIKVFLDWCVKKAYLHRLRHPFATLMLEGRCDLFSLQKMRGHSIRTTTLYLSSTMKLLQEQMLKHPIGSKKYV